MKKEVCPPPKKKVDDNAEIFQIIAKQQVI